MKDLVAAFKKLGFNSYEATAYLTLLQKPNITAYEIGKISGVPQSKIYQTMKGLAEQGLVGVVGDKPAKYVPLPLAEVFNRVRTTVEEAYDYIKENQYKLKGLQTFDYLWHLSGEAEVWGKIKDMIGTGEKTLQIEALGSDLKQLEDNLILARQRGVKITFIVYDDLPFDFGYIYRHPSQLQGGCNQEDERYFILLKDNKEALFLTLSPQSVEGVWSGNKSFVFMVKEYMIYKIYVSENFNRMREEIEEEFGKNFSMLKEELKLQGFDIF